MRMKRGSEAVFPHIRYGERRKEMYDAVIIGAGIVGAMTARELMKYNLKVCVLEKENDVAMGATKANSAIVHAGFDAKPGTLKARLNVRGSEMMKSVTEELGVKYINNGSLVIGFDNEDRATLEQLLERGNENGVKNLRILERDELRKSEPNIGEGAQCALYAPTGAIVCPYELCIAAMGNAMDNGAELKLNFEVKSIVKKDGIYEIASETETVCAKCVVNAAGMYSDFIAGLIGDNSFSVHPRSGEYMLLDRECGTLTKYTVFRTPTKMGKGILVSPTVDGNLLLGPTSVDITDKECNETTAEGFAQIIKEANENVSGITPGKTITSFCGLRAVGSTGDFIITSPSAGFVNAAGIESPGLSASPAIAEYIAEMLGNGGLKLEKNNDFNPYRRPAHYFKNADDAEKNRIIKENPAFGRVICRCETVTEGEITEAIRTNPGARDVDGVKRRTRSGMGRCQGGFCMPYVTEILARELGIPFESVTKSGAGSEITFGKTKGEK